MVGIWPFGRVIPVAVLAATGALILATPLPGQAQTRAHTTPAARVLMFGHGRVAVVGGGQPALAGAGLFVGGRHLSGGELRPPSRADRYRPGAATGKTFTLTITATGRDGKPVNTDVDLVNPSVAHGDLGEVPTPGGRGSVSLPAGTYLVGTGILGGPASNPTNVTITERTVRVGASAPNKVALDARAGKLVDVTVAAPAEKGTEAVSVDYTGSRFGWDETALAAPGQAYVVPVRGEGFTFGVQTIFPGKSTPVRTQYDLGAVTRGQVPARPVYHYQAGQLARVQAAFRAPDAPASGDAGWIPAGVPLVVVPFGVPPLPGSATYYLSTATPFSSMFSYGPPGSSSSALIQSGDHRYSAGSRSTQVWNAGASGPGQFATLGSRAQNVLSYLVDGQFTDAASQQHDGVDSAATTTVTLRRGSTVIKSEKFPGQPFGGPPAFTATLPASPASYTLTASSQRHASYAHLSTSVSSVWHFQSAHTAGTRPLPLLAVQYPVPGLNGKNQGPPSTALSIPVNVLQAPGTPKVVVRTMTVEASTDDGHTWHKLHVSRVGQQWSATMVSPAAGFVSLRASVTAAGGTSAVQTIIRAYAIAG